MEAKSENVRKVFKMAYAILQMAMGFSDHNRHYPIRYATNIKLKIGRKAMPKIFLYFSLIAVLGFCAVFPISAISETFEGYQVKYGTLLVDSCDDSTSRTEISGYEEMDMVTYQAPKSSLSCKNIKKDIEYALKYYQWPDYGRGDGDLVNMIIKARPLYRLKKPQQKGTYQYLDSSESDGAMKLYAKDMQSGKKVTFYIENDYSRFEKLSGRLKKGQQIAITYQPVWVDSFDNPHEYFRLISCTGK